MGVQLATPQARRPPAFEVAAWNYFEILGAIHRKVSRKRQKANDG